MTTVMTDDEGPRLSVIVGTRISGTEAHLTEYELTWEQNARLSRLLNTFRNERRAEEWRVQMPTSGQ